MADGITMAGVTSEPVLTNDQRARGQALIIARDILAQKGGGPFSSVSLSSGDPEPVIRLAEYVLNGYVVTFEGETSDGDEPEPAEVDDDVTFHTRQERDAHGESIESSGLLSWNAQIGHRRGWAAARAYFTEDQEKGQSEPEPDEDEVEAREQKVQRAKHLIRNAIMEQFGEGNYTDTAAEMAVAYLGADGLV